MAPSISTHVTILHIQRFSQTKISISHMRKISISQMLEYRYHKSQIIDIMLVKISITQMRRHRSLIALQCIQCRLFSSVLMTFHINFDVNHLSSRPSNTYLPGLSSGHISSHQQQSKSVVWFKVRVLVSNSLGKKVAKSYSFVLLPTRIPLSVTHLEFVFNLKYDLKGQGIQIRIICKTLETNSFH